MEEALYLYGIVPPDITSLSYPFAKWSSLREAGIGDICIIFELRPYLENEHQVVVWSQKDQMWFVFHQLQILTSLSELIFLDYHNHQWREKDVLSAWSIEP